MGDTEVASTCFATTPVAHVDTPSLKGFQHDFEQRHQGNEHSSQGTAVLSMLGVTECMGQKEVTAAPVEPPSVKPLIIWVPINGQAKLTIQGIECEVYALPEGTERRFKVVDNSLAHFLRLQFAGGTMYTKDLHNC